MATRKHNPEEVKILKKDWTKLLDKLQQVNLKLDDNIQERISQKEFDQIIAYVKNNQQEIFNEFNSLTIGAQFDRQKTKLPRSFSVQYDHNTGQINIDIWLKNKLADDHPDGSKLSSEHRLQGGFNKYSQLLSISVVNEELVISADSGLLVRKQENNGAIMHEIEVQNALASIGVSLPVSVLPEGKSGKFSKKSAHAISLKDLLSQSGAISAEDFQYYCQQVAEKLAKLREFGIVHGDIKAANILIYQGQAYLADLDNLGLVNDFHAIQQGTLGYCLPTEVLVHTNYGLPQNTLPSQMHSALTSSYDTDLYSLAVLIRQACHQLDPQQENPILNKLYAKSLKYLDVSNYVHTCGEYDKDPLDVAKFYEEIAGKVFDFEVDDVEKQKLQQVVQFKRQVQSAEEVKNELDPVHELISKHNSVLLENLMRLHEKYVDNSAVIKSIDKILQMVHKPSLDFLSIIQEFYDHMLNLNDQSLLVDLSHHHENLALLKNDSAHLAQYYDELLLAREIISWTLMQAQLCNYHYKQELFNVGDLHKLENVALNAVEQVRQLIIQKTHKKNMISFHNTNSVLVADKVTNFRLQFAQTEKYDQEYLAKSNEDAAIEYVVNLIAKGDPFVNAPFDKFKYQSVSQMKEGIQSYAQHVKVLENIYGKIYRHEGLVAELTIKHSFVEERLVEMRKILGARQQREQDDFDLL